MNFLLFLWKYSLQTLSWNSIFDEKTLLTSDNTLIQNILFIDDKKVFDKKSVTSCIFVVDPFWDKLTKFNPLPKFFHLSRILRLSADPNRKSLPFPPAVNHPEEVYRSPAEATINRARPSDITDPLHVCA